MTRRRTLPALSVLVLSVAVLVPGGADAQEGADAGGEAEMAPVTAAAPAAPRTTRLQGSAYLGRRRGVVGASVLARPEAGGSRIYLTTTDRRGDFRLDRMPEGSYRVEVRRDGLRTVIKNNVTVRFPFRAVVEIPMQPGEADPAAEPAAVAAANSTATATLIGRVVDQTGEPVDEVNVRLVRGDGRADPIVVRSAGDGSLDPMEILAGEWLLQVNGLGYLPMRARLDFGGEVDLVLVVVPQPGDYQPSPLELLPAEMPIPPPGLDLGPIAPPVAPPEATAAQSNDSD